MAMLQAGYRTEAAAWEEWLLRAVAGSPADVQIMYGIAGERQLPEREIPWLPGYADSRPVRVGNAAHAQLQLDVYGEVMDALYQARQAGLPEDKQAWAVQVALTEHVSRIWREPDHGIWEVRGPAQHFTHSKLMCWVALDRSVKSVEQFGLDGPVDKWRAVRAEIHDDVCANAYNEKLGCFVQAYGSTLLDASLLMIPMVGFLPADDPRMRGTVEAIERRLVVDGLVMRYDSRATDDGLPPGEGAFLACSFWLADNLALLGRRDDARALFERLLALRNDLGLLAEEYDPRAGRLVGNFPQAFSHIGLVDTALNLSKDVPAEQRPAEQRGDGHEQRRRSTRATGEVAAAGPLDT
jgi:GH15 family glucan-1,4-alpha-glucosidase